jgi:urease subunit alpha
MLHNDACPNITVNAQTFDVMIDGKVITCEPAKTVALAQRYMFR